MRIYTITCSNAYNYGAILQTYALQKYLEQLGHEAIVIDYHPVYLRKISDKYKNKKILTWIRNILYAPDYAKSKRVFGEFKKNIKSTKKTYYSFEELEQLPKADLYVAGSDQIWNPYMKNGLDSNYYFEFVPNRKKISYAASVGCRIMDEEYDDYFRKKLADFSHVTVREKETAQYFNRIGIPTDYVLDPVYLLNKDMWESLCEDIITERYILVYALHHIQRIYDYARKLADKLGVKMFVISVEIKEIRRGNDKFFWNPSVNQFLTLIKNTDAVVTNSFHGVSFGMIFKRPLHIFDTETNDIRLSNIVEIFSLEDRTIDIKDSETLSNVISRNACARMEQEIVRSQNLLNRILER